MMTSLRSCTRYPSGGTPPIDIPFFFEAAILSRMRSPMTSRLKCAKDNRTFRVKRPIELVVLNCCVTETKDAPLVSRGGTTAAALVTVVLDPIDNNFTQLAPVQIPNITPLPGA